MSVHFEQVQNSALQQFSPAMHRPASQPPRPYSSSSNPLTSPAPHQQQPSPQSLTRDGGYPSPQTPGYGTPSASYDSYYPQDFGQGQQQVYFNQPNGPVVRAVQQQPQQQRYQQQQLQHPAQTVTPQPMTPQPMTPGSHGAPTPQPPMTPQDGGMMSPAPYVVPQTIQTQTTYYTVQQQQQIVQARPQHGGIVQQHQQQLYSQPQPQVVQPVSRPVTLQPQDLPVASPPSPEPPTTPGKCTCVLVKHLHLSGSVKKLQLAHEFSVLLLGQF